VWNKEEAEIKLTNFGFVLKSLKKQREK